MAADYIVKATETPRGVRLYAQGKEVGDIRTRQDLSYVLTARDGNEWVMTTRVRGEVKPFSMTVEQLRSPDGRVDTSRRTVLTVSNHVFLHKGRFYLFGGLPEGRPLGEFLLGKKYICRLDGFPFADLTEIDHETTSSMRRFRGKPVGEMEGLGKEGHRVHLSEELEDVGLPLAASCYILYSTA